MRKWPAFILVLTLAACISEKQTYDQFGNQAFAIECPGLRPQMCTEQAGVTCPKGYYTVDEGDSPAKPLTKTLTVRCKG
jgi:hypothetical protein